MGFSTTYLEGESLLVYFYLFMYISIPAIKLKTG